MNLFVPHSLSLSLPQLVCHLLNHSLILQFNIKSCLLLLLILCNIDDFLFIFLSIRLSVCLSVFLIYFAPMEKFSSFFVVICASVYLQIVKIYQTFHLSIIENVKLLIYFFFKYTIRFQQLYHTFITVGISSMIKEIRLMFSPKYTFCEVI